MHTQVIWQMGSQEGTKIESSSQQKLYIALGVNGQLLFSVAFKCLLCTELEINLFKFYGGKQMSQSAYEMTITSLKNKAKK